MIDEPGRIIIELDRPLGSGESVTLPLSSADPGLTAAEPVDVVARERWDHPDMPGAFLLLEDEPGHVRVDSAWLRALLIGGGYTLVDSRD